VNARSTSEDGDDEVVQEAAEYGERALQKAPGDGRKARLGETAEMRVLASVASLNASLMLTGRLSEQREVASSDRAHEENGD
jgi:hypothetical protein